MLWWLTASPPRVVYVGVYVQDMVGFLKAIDPMSYEYCSLVNVLCWLYADNPNIQDCWRDSNATAWLGDLPVRSFICMASRVLFLL